MTRVRYKYIEGVFITNKMVAGKNLIDVMIMPAHAYKSYNEAIFYKNSNKDGFKVIKDNSSDKLKKMVKKELKKLGVNFNDEVRPGLKRRR